MGRTSYLPALGLTLFLFLVNTLLAPTFLDPYNLANFLLSALPLAILATGQSLVVLGGGIDLSLGALLTLALVAVAVSFELSPLAAPLLAPLFGGAGGLLNGLLVGYLRLQPLVATFATSFLFGGIALWILPRPGGFVSPWFQDLFRSVWVSPLLFLILWVLGHSIMRTRFGCFLYATGGNPRAAYANGVAVTQVVFWSHLGAGLLAGFAALILLAETGTGDPLVGQAMTLTSIAAVAVGGIRLSGGAGSIEGALLGAVLLTLFGNVVFFLGIPSNLQVLVEGVVVLLALMASSALLGRRL